MTYSPTEIQHLADWAAQECEWQMSGEKSVARLIDATLTAIEIAKYNYPTPGQVQQLGQIVDPRNGDYRHQVVWVGDQEMPPWGRVPELIDAWVEALPVLSPTEAFKGFEQIHPFIDGNGRTGAILYNWLNKTLHPGELQFPPNVFADSRREGITL